ncbi:MAG: calcium/sodium antiporter [Proteobacteria bacterium]|nr:calcium/sodium antiporter [Pseudomonadota bacterium]
MTLTLVLLLVGLVMLVTGAELLVRGGGQLAMALRVPALVVGLTIVAFGTSTPELFVSVSSALTKSTDMALANVNGSNVANIALVLGLAAMVRPLTVDRRLIRREIPTYMALQVGVAVLVWDGVLGRLDGGLLMLGGVVYNLWLLIDVQRQRGIVEVEELEREEDASPWLHVAHLLGGIAILGVGAKLFVDNAYLVALAVGMSERYVGITVLALGTSAPEMATAVVAARRGEVDLAIGNAIGSNILNIAMVLGITAMLQPIVIHDAAAYKDIAVACLVGVVMVPMVLRDRVLSRTEGGLMALTYIMYLVLSGGT